MPDQTWLNFMSQRFFLETKIKDGQTTLEGDQAHHALHVMRFGVGDKIVLFDGRGQEHFAVITETGKKRISLTIETTIKSKPKVHRDITVAVALPKGDRQKFLVEKLVELGVRRLIPLKTERSVAVASAKVIERMNRQVVEASKQCGRNFLMTVSAQRSVKELIATNFEHTIRLIADPYSSSPLVSAVSNKSPFVVIAIGPEGGFAEDESIAMSEGGWEPVKLGNSILRIETAAVTAAVLLGIGAES